MEKGMRDVITLPEHVLEAIGRLEAAGYGAYAVGGCVRDALRGVTPYDHDIATSALPSETARVFGDLRVISTGIAHGTVTVLFGSVPLEITTFRTDGEYADHRRPDSVSFTDRLQDDLARRDLTVNAMAYSPRLGLVDPFGGRADLDAGILRAVGDPEKRFEEDALRILRAARFSSTLGMRIHPDTHRAMLSHKALLLNVSAERKLSELSKLLVGDGCERTLLENAPVITEVLPELAPSVGFDQRNPHHIYDVYTHTAKAVQSCPRDRNIRLAALLHDCGKPYVFSVGADGYGHFYGHTEKSLELAEGALERLKADNASTKEILTLIRWHDPVIEETETSVKRWIRRLGAEMLEKLLALKSADNLAQAPEYQDRLRSYDRIRGIMKKLLDEEACFSLRELAVKGDDLIALGMKPGKELGRMLSSLLDAVISGELQNDKQILLDFVGRNTDTTDTKGRTNDEC